MAASVLIVDDEKNIRRTLRMVLENAGYEVFDESSAEAALDVMLHRDPDLVLADIRLGGMSGIDLLRTAKARRELGHIPFIVISGHASLAEAVDSIQLGATDFLEKPLDRDRLLVTVQNALDAYRLKSELRKLRAQVHGPFRMIGEAPAMKELYRAIEKVAPTRGRVLITGESGTGKELIARAIHELSDRSESAFVMLNCAAIPAELIESELFGHERGAFTGATTRKKGLFELADGGTLFLDEIGDMSMPAQAKVLRALQSGEISRVGGEQAIAVDVRVLAATNKDLEAEVRAGRFRDDLYFRLNVVPIHTPPLRDRPEDIPLLARAFLQDFAREYGGDPELVDPAVFERLRQREWPGNVRELRNVVERMVILNGMSLTAAEVPTAGDTMPPPARESSGGEAGLGASGTWVRHGDGRDLTLKAFRERAEETFIRAVLDDTEWNISRAAVRLGVERTNLHKKMRAYGIRREDPN